MEKTKRTTRYFGRSCWCVTLCLAILVGLSGCRVPSSSESGPDLSGYTSKLKTTNAYFATESTLCIYDDFSVPANVQKFERAWEETKALLHEIEQAVSVAVEGSDIARFNALGYGEQVAVGPHTAAILAEAKRVYDETGGIYDPTAYPLVDLWALAPRFNVNDYVPTQAYDRPRNTGGSFPLPDAAFVEGFTALVDFGGVRLGGDETVGYTLTKMIEPVEIGGVSYEAALDLGSIAKGYAVDLVEDLLHDLGYAYGYFSSGGSSMALLQSASSASVDGFFDLGMRKPRPGEDTGTSYITVAIRDRNLSTSGDYSHFYRLDGTLYCHIMDVGTGYPVNVRGEAAQNGIATVTILGEGAAYIDGISTALCIMGPERAIDYVNENLAHLDVVMVFFRQDFQHYEVVTNIPEGSWTLEDDAYRVVSEVDDAGHIRYIGEFYAELM